MQSSAVKMQSEMLDMDTPSCLLSLLSAPFWSCLENNKKNVVPKPKQKFYVPLFIKNELFCCPKHHPETCQESSAQYQQADQVP